LFTQRRMARVRRVGTKGLRSTRCTVIVDDSWLVPFDRV
jgi:hypothetical protein